MKKPRNWERIGAIAGIVGAVVAVVALVPTVRGLVVPSNHQRVFDGPIAQIAVHQKGWDMRGFNPSDMNSVADQVEYQFAGHYTDPNGDRNPGNVMCGVTLHANPSSSFPYDGESGFVYIQTGTPRHPQGVVLYNPTLETVYTTRLDYEYVPPECWPGNMRYPHVAADYR